MVIVEVGLKLDKEQKYYEEILKKHGAINTFNCKTHDMYWTNKDLNGMTENEMKNSCVRLRITQGIGGEHFNGNSNWHRCFGNCNLFDSDMEDKFEATLEKMNEFIKKMESKGWTKVFDTYKTDFQFSIGDMKSRIQLQDIKDIGLLLYYDNPDYYEYPLDEQRKMLIDELNSYGFDFKEDELGLDKLRTLYYHEPMYSKNQNG